MTDLIKCECGIDGYIIVEWTLRTFRIKCKYCGKKTEWHDTEAEAIEAWNRRVSE